jgi:hypothetical protein
LDQNSSVPGLPTQRPGVPLERALENAHLVVTVNSNCGVLAAVAGVPVVATDEGAMCWPVAGHYLSDPPQRPDRGAWCDQLAWAQWTLEEIRAGEAWEHLAKGL